MQNKRNEFLTRRLILHVFTYSDLIKVKITICLPHVVVESGSHQFEEKNVDPDHKAKKMLIQSDFDMKTS